ncbi:Uncharacterised protein [Providencia alcalifaciens]|nr:Uncharacterised protein [Providencia alcalifaciens]
MQQILTRQDLTYQILLVEGNAALAAEANLLTLS